MKMVTAYIQTHKLNEVKQELFKVDIIKMSVTNSLGCGQQGGYIETYRGVDLEVNLLKKLRIDIAVNDEYVNPAVDAIIEGAHTGEIGDGKIFVTNIEECIRIRSKERGELAIG